MSALLTDSLRAIADPTRRAILDLLAERERGVGELGAEFDCTQPAISQHLKVLRDAGLVDATRAGKQQIYRVIPDGFAPVREWMAQYERFWNAKLDQLGRVLDALPDDPPENESWNRTPRRTPRKRAASSTPKSASRASTRTRARKSGAR